VKEINLNLLAQTKSSTPPPKKTNETSTDKTVDQKSKIGVGVVFGWAKKKRLLGC
jgi:hypothetical protein